VLAGAINADSFGCCDSGLLAGGRLGPWAGVEVGETSAQLCDEELGMADVAAQSRRDLPHGLRRWVTLGRGSAFGEDELGGHLSKLLMERGD